MINLGDSGMSAAVCSECKQTVEASAKFCAGCGAPQASGVQANKPTSSRKKPMIIGGVVAAVALIGLFLIVGSKSTTADNTSNADTNSTGASNNVQAPSQGQQSSREELAHYTDFSQHLARLSVMMLTNDNLLISKLEENSHKKDLNGSIASVQGYVEATQSLAKHVEELQIPDLSNKATLQAATDAKQNLKGFELCQEEMAKLLFAEARGEIKKEKLIADSKAISERKTLLLNTFRLELLSGYNDFGIKPEDIDSETIVPKQSVKQQE
jgi:hypothetical protein